jgi:hypothetical protein
LAYALVAIRGRQNADAVLVVDGMRRMHLCIAVRFARVKAVLEFADPERR